jgi:hypothetical protein|nr:hypothetical protein [Neorhizobium tomejilense]
MAGGKRGSGDPRPRQDADWYPTPKDVTCALFDRVKFEGAIYEPCCGDGSLALVAEEDYSYDVFGTDLHNRGYGVGHGQQFDALTLTELLAPNVVTNPPFNKAAEIIEHLWSLGPDSMAMLLKSTFWHADTRRELFNRIPPSKIIALTWRPDFLGLNRPTMEVIWCLWERGHKGPTEYELAERPEWARKKKGRKRRDD